MIARRPARGLIRFSPLRVFRPPDGTLSPSLSKPHEDNSLTLRTSFLSSAVLLSVCSCVGHAQSSTARIADNANAFLSTLDDQQRKSVLFAYDDEEQRKRWSNFPISIVQRRGLSMKDFTPEQAKAAMTLLASALSPRGFEKVQQIMDADEALKTSEGGGRGGPGPGGPGNGPPADRGNGPQRGPGGRGGGRGPGGGLLFGKDLYFFSILGTPSTRSPWMLQFGGHHLALNITIDGDRGILTPTLTGAQPAVFTQNGQTIRPLGRESDKALALLNALDENQRRAAILSYRVSDLVLGPGQDGKTIQPEGLKATGMNERQRTMLLDVVSEWTGIIHESAAAERMAQLRAEVSSAWFAWSGPTAASTGGNITAYFRIQSPHLVIEYSPQNMGGDAALHIHTMYRDPTNDYGRKPPAK